RIGVFNEDIAFLDPGSQISDNIGVGRFQAFSVIELPDKIAVRGIDEFGENDCRKITPFNQLDYLLGNRLGPFVDEMVLNVDD
ncbi:hypothetical protein COT97_05770, partial [Candidatus Falkowbacteria bacterium CG10_big_fil_rev_8_21_14_0_10_39_11]